MALKVGMWVIDRMTGERLLIVLIRETSAGLLFLVKGQTCWFKPQYVSLEN